MSIPVEQAATADLLRRLTGAEPRETPISAVFVGASSVFKLRKAVRLSFLDFSTIALRERFARRELELNAPHAPGLYRTVRAVARGDGGAAHLSDRPSEDREIIDWVVETAPVPSSDFFTEIAAKDALGDALIDAIADEVAAYHQSLPAMRRDQLAAMRAIVEGNVASAHAAGLPSDEVEAWRSEATAALDARAEWLDARDDDGFVRRAHGDLHLGNLCLWQGRPVAFDALEFDEDLAVIDVAYDLAFLLMDVERRAKAGRAAANRLLNRYVARIGDASLVGGLAPFLSLRAMVRAHVERAGGDRASAESYLADARAALAPSRPTVVAIGGLPGSGKSTYARLIAPDLGPAPGALIVRSDETRKRLWGEAPEARLPPAAYAAAENRRVTEAMGEMIRAASGLGHAVIADATFLQAADRAAIERLPHGDSFVGVWLDAPLGDLAARVAARQGDASDATVDVLRCMAASQPDAAPAGWIRVDTTNRDAALALIKVALNQAAKAC